MKIVISGASGLIGKELCDRLHQKDHEILRLVRREVQDENEIFWEPLAGEIDAEKLESVDGVVHLAGENIAGYWTKGKKERIERSRVAGTTLLAKAIAGLKNPLRIFVCASAIGFYGDRGEEVVTEESPAGEGFLVDVSKKWEGAAQACIDKDIRTCLLRIGIVISPKGGALKAMLPAFKMGVAGRIGDGMQYMSWISISDLVSVICECLESEKYDGVINAVAPKAVTNLEFTKALGRVLKRPTIFPLPAFVVKTIFGEMGREVLLRGTNVKPRVLLDARFEFEHEELEGCLRDLLNKKNRIK